MRIFGLALAHLSSFVEPALATNVRVSKMSICGTPTWIVVVVVVYFLIMFAPHKTQRNTSNPFVFDCSTRFKDNVFSQ